MKTPASEKAPLKVMSTERRNLILSRLRPSYVNAVKRLYFGSGFWTGASLMMTIQGLMLMIISHDEDVGVIHELSLRFYPVFRCVTLIALWFVYFGVTLFVWRRAGVPYARYLRTGPTLTHQYVLKHANAVVVVVMFFFFLYAMALISPRTLGFVPEHIWPLLSITLPLCIMVIPGSCGLGVKGAAHPQALITEIGWVLCSPFSETTFLRSFIADVFTSMPKIFTDILYTACIFTSGTAYQESPRSEGVCKHHPTYLAIEYFLKFVPYYVRLMQSARAARDSESSSDQRKHCLNGLKYTCSLILSSISVFQSQASDPISFARLKKAWTIMSIVCTVYSYSWDLRCDWGLCKDGRFLRPPNQCLFPAWLYYMAAGSNLVMRLGWAVYISPDVRWLVADDVILLLAAVELLRRFQWAIYRLEWEHMKHNSHESSAGEFGSMSEVAISPIGA